MFLEKKYIKLPLHLNMRQKVMMSCLIREQLVAVVIVK